MSNSVWGVVVARVAHGAKSRLAPVLEPHQRRSLALSMLSDVLRVCANTLDGLVAVVDDDSARLEAERLGAIVLDDSHPADMNDAVRRGLRAAAARGARTTIVLPGDIPLVSARDLAALLAASRGQPRAVIIGASRDGHGTNALLLRPPHIMAPAFGPPSVDRHFQAGIAAGAFTRVLRGLDLALDVDTPADLATLAQSAGRAG
jgi:2-phospho-L-lactate/phosphoenolpyruvate guanylyltransferase